MIYLSADSCIWPVTRDSKVCFTLAQLYILLQGINQRLTQDTEGSLAAVVTGWIQPLRHLATASLTMVSLPVNPGPPYLAGVSYGSSSPFAQRYIPSAQHVVPHTVAHGTICCVVSLDCDAPRRDGKQRYDDFLSVVHFRKVVYSNKVGSIRNGNAVITLCFYKSDFNFYWLT